jgi:hypothetical protein|tara:strand:+ start:953 stop:1309 length:357 start_codon:yes stop_codon:yes gene_type:complete
MAKNTGDKEKRKKAPRSTGAVKEYRVHKLARMMAQGANQMDCVQYVEQEWGLTKSSGKRLYREALTEVREIWSLDRTDFAALLLQQLNDLHKKTSTRQNDSVTLGCINSAAKIARLFD